MAAEPGKMASERAVTIGPLRLNGDLRVPRGAWALVIFAHGSGSSRFSVRNRLVAEALNRQGIATLLFDLLTTDEENDRAYIFDIVLLAKRLADVVSWAGEQVELAALPIGVFGASTGAAAALMAAAERGSPIAAIVSRGGRPDLAGPALPYVSAPTLLIVGGDDDVVITLNEQAYAQLKTTKALEIVPGASHLFPESGAMDSVIALAGRWFAEYLAPQAHDKRTGV
ncbi:MAG: dienelactone hydrolase family protein [Proteobacteria bacterium]|nr:dienelactone hydrolase family protein [Pseudomonadota bacterium]